MNKQSDVWTVTAGVWGGGYAKTENSKTVLGPIPTSEVTRNLVSKS